MTELKVAALQLAFTGDVNENIANVSALVREAAAKGAKVVLPPELFEGLYFCRTEDEGLFANARPLDAHPAVRAMQGLAAELEVHIPLVRRKRQPQRAKPLKNLYRERTHRKVHPVIPQLT